MIMKVMAMIWSTRSSSPVFMLEESAKYMEVVGKTGKEIEEAEKTALIVNLLSALVIVIGLGGSSLVSLGFRTPGRTLAHLAEAGKAVRFASNFCST
jgi:glucose-6-phosphate isomerase